LGLGTRWARLHWRDKPKPKSAIKRAPGNHLTEAR
jgi:hypothetical protein